MCWRCTARRRTRWTNAAPGNGPVLIEVKTMRMKGHAQHDPAEYVPKEMFEHWKARDPIALYEKYLTENKIWDAKKKSEIDARIERELDEEQKFAEESPLPPPELAERGVYCDGCHTIEAEWQRPKEEVMPPKASIEAAWTVQGFGGIEGEIPGAKEVAAGRQRREAGRAACENRRKNARRSREGNCRRRTAMKRLRRACRLAAVRRTRLSCARLGITLGAIRGTSGEGANGRDHDARSDPPGAVRRDGARPGGGRAGRRHRRLRRRVQSDRRVAGEIRARARDRHADQRNGDRGRGLRHELSRPAARGGDAVHRFHRLLLQPGDELRREVALPLGRAGADGDARAFGRRRARRAISFGESGDVFRAHAGAEGGLSLDRVRRQGLAEVGDSRQQSGALFRAQVPLPAHQGRDSGGGLLGSHRQGRGAPRRAGI